MHADNVPAEQRISAVNAIGRHDMRSRQLLTFDSFYQAWLKLVKQLCRIDPSNKPLLFRS